MIENRIIEKGVGRRKKEADGKRFLIVETGPVDDVIRATALIEKLHKHFPEARIDFLLNGANESLIRNHPHLEEILAWIEGPGQTKRLISRIRELRQRKYNAVINASISGASGLITAFSGASRRIGFAKHPLSFLFSKKVPWVAVPAKAFGRPLEEQRINRNLDLIKSFTDFEPEAPRLYPEESDFEHVRPLKNNPYVCLAPTSFWFSDRFPLPEWRAFLQGLPTESVFLTGDLADRVYAEKLIEEGARAGVHNLCGKLTWLQNAALLQDSDGNYLSNAVQISLSHAVGTDYVAVNSSTVPPRDGLSSHSNDASR